MMDNFDFSLALTWRQENLFWPKPRTPVVWVSLAGKRSRINEREREREREGEREKERERERERIT